MVFGVTEDIKVLKTSPEDSQSKVPLTTEIKVFFSQAIDAATLHTGTFIVARNAITPIAGSVRYEALPNPKFGIQDGDFVGIFTPSEPLQPETQYQITLVGLSHPFTGGTNSVIKNVVGNAMGHNEVFAFSTGSVSALPPVIELPVEYSSITEVRPTFRWTAIAGADKYEIMVGTSELMDPLYLPPGWSQTFPLDIPGDQTEFSPDVPFETGKQYYWKMRTYIDERWSAWSLLHSFYILEPGQEVPYLPEREFEPGQGAYELLTGNEPFRLIAVEPADMDLDQEPEYIKAIYNKQIDPDSIDINNIQITGHKVQQSDPNTTSPGAVGIDDAYVDPEQPNILVIIPNGGSAPVSIGGSGSMTAAWYENLFRDIQHLSARRYGFGKHFLDLTERVSGQDNLYTDTRISQLRLARREPYPVGEWIGSTFEIEAPGNIKDVQMRSRFEVEDDTQIRIRLSSDGGATYMTADFAYDPEDDIQTVDVPINPGAHIRVKVEMMSESSDRTPRMEWFTVLFNVEVSP